MWLVEKVIVAARKVKTITFPHNEIPVIRPERSESARGRPKGEVRGSPKIRCYRSC